MPDNLSVVHGDLFGQDAEAYVNTVNCVGVMGKGIALEFKRRYPAMFAEYQKACNLGHLRPGRLQLWTDLDNHKTVVNFPTKDHWRNPSTTEYVRLGLEELVRVANAYGIRSVAMPPLGCGNGGLSLDVVRPFIEAAAGRMPGTRIMLVIR